MFERLLHKRMLSFFNCNNVLVPTQYGFRHKRCTIHPILDLITSCHDNIQNKDISALLLLDIKKSLRLGFTQYSTAKIRTLWY